MVTYQTVEYGQREGVACRRIEGTCLSTDEKPTENILNGSRLQEMDTSREYLFDEENALWLRWTGSGGGGGGSSSQAETLTVRDRDTGDIYSMELSADDGHAIAELTEQ